MTPLTAKLLGGLALVLALLAGLLWFEHDQQQIGAKVEDAKNAVQIEAGQAIAIAAGASNAAESQRRIAAGKEQDHEDATHAQQAIDARASLDTAAAGLQQRVAAVAARCSGAASDSSASAVSSGKSPGGVLADLSGGLATVARRYADIAESNIEAGESCSVRYDTLTPPK